MKPLHHTAFSLFCPTTCYYGWYYRCHSQTKCLASMLAEERFLSLLRQAFQSQNDLDACNPATSQQKDTLEARSILMIFTIFCVICEHLWVLWLDTRRAAACCSCQLLLIASDWGKLRMLHDSKTAQRLWCRIIDRLEYVHNCGLLYRDIKQLVCTIQSWLCCVGLPWDSVINTRWKEANESLPSLEIL